MKREKRGIRTGGRVYPHGKIVVLSAPKDKNNISYGRNGDLNGNDTVDMDTRRERDRRDGDMKGQGSHAYTVEAGVRRQPDGSQTGATVENDGVGKGVIIG